MTDAMEAERSIKCVQNGLVFPALFCNVFSPVSGHIVYLVSAVLAFTCQVVCVRFPSPISALQSSVCSLVLYLFCNFGSCSLVQYLFPCPWSLSCIVQSLFFSSFSHFCCSHIWILVVWGGENVPLARPCLKQKGETHAAWKEQVNC